MIVLVALVSGLTAGCSGSHEIGDAAVDAPSPAPDAGPPTDAGPPNEAPLTCVLRPTGTGGLPVVLEPEPGNPASCSTPAPCQVWFGHGQHLACPRWDGTPSPIDVACDIWDCICDDRMGFVADFATNEAVDTRAGAECRYRIVLE